MKNLHPRLSRLMVVLMCALLLTLPIASAEGGWEGHLFMDEYAMGNCYRLTGDVRMAVLFVTLPDAPWTPDELAATSIELNEAIRTLTAEAASYGARLSITPEYHHASAEVPPVLNDSEEWADSMLHESNGLPDRYDEIGWDGMPALIFLNTDGRAFAHSEYSTEQAEYAILFRGADAGTIRHELLHLYGASDYYVHSEVEAAAKACFPDSIMLVSDRENRTESLTAYIVGWTEELDASAVRFLALTRDITEEDLDAAREANQITGFGTVTSDTSTYTGMLSDGIRNGWGVMEWADGASYQGGWDWGNRNGKGYYVWASGSTYLGDYIDGERTGWGTYTWDDGSSYTGDFVLNQRTGRGTYTWASGNTYTGDFVDNVRTGKGSFTWPDGDMYIGDFVNDKRHGKGTYLWADGDCYTGDFVENTRTGKGTYTWPGGNVYTGDFLDGERTGTGTFIWANGTVYHGEFLNGSLHGQGVYTWPDGSTYSGSFVNGQREGYGVYRSASGSVMDGQWRSGDFIGQ